MVGGTERIVWWMVGEEERGCVVELAKELKTEVVRPDFASHPCLSFAAPHLCLPLARRLEQLKHAHALELDAEGVDVLLDRQQPVKVGEVRRINAHWSCVEWRGGK